MQRLVRRKLCLLVVWLVAHQRPPVRLSAWKRLLVVLLVERAVEPKRNQLELAELVALLVCMRPMLDQRLVGQQQGRYQPGLLFEWRSWRQPDSVEPVAYGPLAVAVVVQSPVAFGWLFAVGLRLISGLLAD